MDFDTYTQIEAVDLLNEETKYLVQVYGFSKGKNRIEISLSPTETDTLLLYAQEVDFSSFSGPVYSSDSLFYNGETPSLKKMRDGTQILK